MEKKVNLKLILFAPLFILIILSIQNLSYAQTNEFDYLKGISGVWADAVGSTMEIRLEGEEKFIIINKAKFTTKPVDVDSTNEIIKLQITDCLDKSGKFRFDKNDEIFFYFRLIFEKDANSYHLLWMSEKNGEQNKSNVELYFKHK